MITLQEQGGRSGLSIWPAPFIFSQLCFGLPALIVHGAPLKGIANADSPLSLPPLSLLLLSLCRVRNGPFAHLNYESALRYQSPVSSCLLFLLLPFLLPYFTRCSEMLVSKAFAGRTHRGVRSSGTTRHFGANTNARAQAPVFDALSHMAPYHGKVRRGRARA